MAKKAETLWLTDEVAEFFARSPSREELLAYRPSPAIQKRWQTLLAKSKAGSLSSEEEWELNQHESIEMLMQAIKARLRTSRVAKP